MCECFFQDWLKLKAENLELLQVFFVDGKPQAETIKDFISKSIEPEFGVSVRNSCLQEVDGSIVHVCQNCFKKTIEAQCSENDWLLHFAHCVDLFLKNKLHFSCICKNCETFILSRIPQEELFSIGFYLDENNNSDHAG